MNMRWFYAALALIVVVVMLLVPMLAGNAYGAPITTLDGTVLDDEVDYSYVQEVQRYANGKIKRSVRVLNAFVRLHPCPSTGEKSITCPGWQINHKTPMACGGADAVYNMQWLPYDVKHCSGPHCVDSFERKVNAYDPPVPESPVCANQIVP